MSSNLHILHVYKTSMPSSHGGVESFIDTLCRADSKLGIHNTVLSLHRKPDREPIQMEGYTVQLARENLNMASTGFSLSAFKKFKQLSSEADIIHYHFPNPFVDLLHLFVRPQKPSVVTYHSDIIRQSTLLHLYRPIKKRFLGLADSIVATSPNYLFTSKTLNEFKEKVAVIPIGVEHDRYNSPSPECLDHWQNRLTKPFFLFIGEMRYYKGLEIALDAIRGTKFKLIIVGAGELEQKLKSKACALRLNNVVFLGSVSEEDKIALLHLAYGFVFPSHLRSEAFGIALLEAASVGKPLISCEIGTGTSFVNLHYETGLVIKPGSPDELRNAMEYLLNNPRKARKMGENARKRSLALFSADKQAQAYFDLYSDLITKANNRIS